VHAVHDRRFEQLTAIHEGVQTMFIHPKYRRLTVFAGTLWGLTAAYAQLPPAVSELNVPAVLPPTVEGDWVRTDTHGSGSYGGLLLGYPQASIKPEYAALARGGRGGRGGGPTDGQPGVQGQGRGGAGANGGNNGQDYSDGTAHVAGQPYVVRTQTCGYNGAVQGGLEYDSEGFHMVVGKDEAVMLAERGASRRIYLDGRAIPDATVRPPTGAGYSVGHIEPDGTMVIDISDASAGAVTAGGYRLTDTHFIEKLIPSADGKRLIMRFEYNDPRIYEKPHVVEFTFDRMAAGSYALDEFCDATDPLEGQSIVPPQQQ
jgi:hypothetical protein